MGNYFFYQTNKLDAYYEKIQTGEKPVVMCARQSVHNALFRNLSGQMDAGCCNIREIGKHYGFDLEDIFAGLLAQWERVGLITLKDGWVELTLAGQFWQVNLTQAIIDYFRRNIGNGGS